MKLKYYRELDGVRGLAALMVMFFHFMPGADGGTHHILQLVKKVSVFGQTGVTLFFVLSGFLITRILLQSKQYDNYFKNFYIRRSLRIFPLYYLALTLYYFVFPLIEKTAVLPISHTWAYWVYLQNFSETFKWGFNGPQHFWSLAVEEHFYLFWPFIVYYISNKSLLKVVVAIIVLALGCRLLFVTHGIGTFYFTFTTMDCLAIGALLALNEMYQWISFKQISLIALVSLILLLPLWFVFGGAHNNIIQIIKLPVIAVFYGGIIGMVITRPTVLNKFFELTFLKFSGKISYGLYVFHPFCLEFWDHYLPNSNPLVKAIAFLFFSYAIAMISFYIFELRFINLKKYFETSATKRNPDLKLESKITS